MVLKGAKIYRLINNKGDVYYGSTCSTLKIRLDRHKKAYYYWFYHNYQFCYSFVVMHNQKFKIQLVERCYEVKDKQQLKERERFYIENYPCCNHNVPARTIRESYTAYNQKPDRKEHLKSYYQQNREKIKEYQKAYYQSKLKSN